MKADKHDEIICVVDSSGNTLEKVKRAELKDSHTWKIICVWIENDNNQVLLQQRSLKKKLGPGLWTCAVEGTVEDEDSYLETAKREVEEEIGLTDFELIPAKQVLYKSSLGSRLAQGYLVKCNWPVEQFTPQPEEVEKLQWRDKHTTIKQLQDGHPDFPRAGQAWLEMFDLV